MAMTSPGATGWPGAAGRPLTVALAAGVDIGKDGEKEITAPATVLVLEKYPDRAVASSVLLCQARPEALRLRRRQQGDVPPGGQGAFPHRLSLPIIYGTSTWPCTSGTSP